MRRRRRAEVQSRRTPPNFANLEDARRGLGTQTKEHDGRPLEAGNAVHMTASKKMGVSTLQTQGAEFCQ